MSTPPDLWLQGRRLQQPPGPMWRSRPGGLQFGKEKTWAPEPALPRSRGCCSSRRISSSHAAGRGSRGCCSSRRSSLRGATRRVLISATNGEKGKPRKEEKTLTANAKNSPSHKDSSAKHVSKLLDAASTDHKILPGHTLRTRLNHEVVT